MAREEKALGGQGYTASMDSEETGHVDVVMSRDGNIITSSS